MSSLSAGIFILSAVSIHGFLNSVSRHGTARPHQRTTNMPPLFYTDIEPEIRAITVPPINLQHFNDTISSPTHYKDRRKKKDVSAADIDNDDKATTKRKRGRPATKPKKTEKQIAAYKPHKVVWNKRYNELIEYLEEHGHCMVPQRYPKLGLWVMQQRRQYALLHQEGKKSSFDSEDGAERIKLLEDIGFVWRVEKGGPRGVVNGGLRRMRHRHDTVIKKEGFISEKDEIMFAVDMEKYMIEKKYETDEEKINAWRQRYELFN